MEIKFAQGFYAWKDFNEEVQNLIIQNGFKNIGEIGGGANPLLALDFVEKQNLQYHVIDVSTDELAKAGKGYKKIQMDLEQPIDPTTQYDFIFAQMTLEHIKDPHLFYTNVYKLLKPGGQAYFFFACITSLPSFINLVIPESISEKILVKLQPFRRHEKHGKFKAYYKWCFGPTQKQISRFKELKYEVLSYTGYFGHSYYHRIKALNFLEKIKTKLLLKYPNPYFCTYAHVLLKK